MSCIPILYVGWILMLALLKASCCYVSYRSGLWRTRLINVSNRRKWSLILKISRGGTYVHYHYQRCLVRCVQFFLTSHPMLLSRTILHLMLFVPYDWSVFPMFTPILGVWVVLGCWWLRFKCVKAYGREDS